MTTSEPDLGDQHRQGGCLLVLLACMKSPGQRRLGAQEQERRGKDAADPTDRGGFVSYYVPSTSTALGQLPAAAIASAAVRLPCSWNQRPGPSVLPAANVAQNQEPHSIDAWTGIDLSSTPVCAASLTSRWLSLGAAGQISTDNSWLSQQTAGSPFPGSDFGRLVRTPLILPLFRR